jgi:hypothetical protein
MTGDVLSTLIFGFIFISFLNQLKLSTVINIATILFFTMIIWWLFVISLILYKLIEKYGFPASF